MDNFGYVLSLVMAAGAFSFLFAMIVLRGLPRRGSARIARLSQFVRAEGGTLFFMMSTIAVVTSLIYSELIGWEPCLLCWYQRIFYYPLPLLAGFALYRKKFSEAVPYLTLLVWGGLIIAAWHTMLQQIPGLRPALSGLSACSVSGPSCFDRYVEIFGFITIPLMSLVVFTALLLLLRFLKAEQGH